MFKGTIVRKPIILLKNDVYRTEKLYNVTCNFLLPFTWHLNNLIYSITKTSLKLVFLIEY